LFGSSRHVTQGSAISGAIGSLAQTGLSLDDQGHLPFDAATFASRSAEAVQGFLGGLATGRFLETADNAPNGVEDATSGALTTAISSNASEINHENTLITAEQRRITTLQSNLTKQMAAAGTLLASLESPRTT
jgi:flagellar capping protein FliD